MNVFYAMAARNLVLAEQMKTDIALVCNGCYKSIWEVNHKLKHNQDLKDGVNEVLKEIDMEFKGTIMFITSLNSCMTIKLSVLTRSGTA